jgi:hypothetical protein
METKVHSLLQLNNANDNARKVGDLLLPTTSCYIIVATTPTPLTFKFPL